MLFLYTTIALVHVGGVIAFQYTGVEWFLLFAALQGLFSALLFMVASAALFSKLVGTADYEIEKNNTGVRLLIQIATIITAAQLYFIGYEFISGVIFITAATLSIMILCIILENFIKKNGD